MTIGRTRRAASVPTSLSGLLGSRIIRSVRVIGLRHRTDHDLLGHESRDQRGRGMPVVKTGWREHRSGRVGEHTIRGFMHIVDVRESACAGDHGNALQQPQRRDRRNDDHAGSTDEAPQPHQGHHPHDLWLPPRQQPHRAHHAPLRRTRHTPTTTKNLTHENSRSPSILQFHYKGHITAYARRRAYACTTPATSRTRR